MFNEPNETADRSSSSTLTREITRLCERALASSQPLSDLWLRYRLDVHFFATTRFPVTIGRFSEILSFFAVSFFFFFLVLAKEVTFALFLPLLCLPFYFTILFFKFR